MGERFLLGDNAKELFPRSDNQSKRRTPTTIAKILENSSKCITSWGVRFLSVDYAVNRLSQFDSGTTMAAQEYEEDGEKGLFSNPAKNPDSHVGPYVFILAQTLLGVSRGGNQGCSSQQAQALLAFFLATAKNPQVMILKVDDARASGSNLVVHHNKLKPSWHSSWLRPRAKVISIVIREIEIGFERYVSIHFAADNINSFEADLNLSDYYGVQLIEPRTTKKVTVGNFEDPVVKQSLMARPSPSLLTAS
ncbi:uncharacterized protein LY89DRAFT_669189 [Mollisia scopiformis]|uniref:Uncharacterized protein n=1 Tax=Mollisia scopiformis TaxID=149040 RepID=A0A194X977_MOLSC|nr:uncharacterized protein LY89DRAFT_669189 [Mollisia scopiformis]KUJ16726.1 hypothetical protein LY89DRAFT_669189 [Mollisia scopiformis]